MYWYTLAATNFAEILHRWQSARKLTVLTIGVEWMEARSNKGDQSIAASDIPEPADDPGTRRPQVSRAGSGKGLDVLEALAGVSEPLTTPQLAERLGRSPSELFGCSTSSNAVGTSKSRDSGKVTSLPTRRSS